MSFRAIPLIAVTALLGGAADARAHCDTLSGPVVGAAREALRTGDVTPALRWVRLAMPPILACGPLPLAERPAKQVRRRTVIAKRSSCVSSR